MTTVAAFQAGADTGDPKRDARWRRLDNPPHLVSYGPRDYLVAPRGPGARSYVNGVPVVGMQVLCSMDLVQVFNGRRRVSYCYAGRPAGVRQEFDDVRCAFTGLTIRGEAMRCSGCGRVLSVAAVEQMDGRCICGAGLDGDLPEPPEELL